MQALVRVACGHVARLAAVRSKFQEKTSSLLSTTEFWTEVRFAIKQEETRLAPSERSRPSH